MTNSIYLDSNPIIRFVESEEDNVTALVLAAFRKDIQLVTSELTLAEVLVVPVRDADSHLIETYEALLQNDDLLTVVPIDRPTLRRSAELRAQLGCKGLDAIHSATADLAGCHYFLSSDRRLRVPPSMRKIAVEDADDLVRNLQ